MKRRHILGIGACAALPVFATRAAAQAKPLTIVVGYGAGSSVDLVARRTAERLGPILKRTVLVENKTGAGGQLALTAIAAGPADGSLVAFTAPAPLTIFPATYDRLPYEAKDFVAVGATCSVEAGFVVGSAHPAKTLEEFAKWAKDHPCSIGNPGHATGPHFNVWQFARAAGIDVQHVPYRTIPQLALEVAMGQLNAGFSAMPAFMELIKAGRLRLLATAGSKRAPLFPQVPTFAELGYTKVQAEDWYGFVANARVAQPFRTELADALRNISKDAEYRDAILAMGLIPEYQDTQTLVRRMKADTAKWAELVKLTGFKSAST